MRGENITFQSLPNYRELKGLHLEVTGFRARILFFSRLQVTGSTIIRTCMPNSRPRVSAQSWSTISLGFCKKTSSGIISPTGIIGNRWNFTMFASYCIGKTVFVFCTKIRPNEEISAKSLSEGHDNDCSVMASNIFRVLINYTEKSATQTQFCAFSF